MSDLERAWYRAELAAVLIGTGSTQRWPTVKQKSKAHSKKVSYLEMVAAYKVFITEE